MEMYYKTQNVMCIEDDTTNQVIKITLIVLTIMLVLSMAVLLGWVELEVSPTTTIEMNTGMRYLSVLVIAFFGIPIIISQIFKIHAYTIIINRNGKRVSIDYTKGMFFHKQARLNLNQIGFYIETHSSEDGDSYSLMFKFDANELDLEDFDDYREAEECLNRIKNFMYPPILEENTQTHPF